MDLDGRMLKAERREVRAQHLGIGRVRPHHDVPRLLSSGQRLAAHRNDGCRIERDGFAHQPFGHRASELHRALEVPFLARAFFGAQFDPCRGELRCTFLAPLGAGLVAQRTRRPVRVIE